MRQLILAGALALVSTGSAITIPQVTAAFKQAGLEALKPTPLTRDKYGMAPFVGKGVRFLIPSIGVDAGGRIFDVPNRGERQRLAGYYTEMGKQSALFYSHVFVHKNIVVQINGDLSDAKAAKYKAALLKLR